MIKVLIVEDDPMVAEFNRRYLAQVAGFELAAIARNGDEAIAYINGKKVDLMLLDIFMPGMNGLNLMMKIRQQQQSVDVIVVSAAQDTYSIKTALRYGAVDYLIKPFDFERLRDALLRYRQRESYMQKPEIQQQELDQCILQKNNMIHDGLPKGLDRNTLKNVWQAIKEQHSIFTTEELAKKVGISRVSMRKYLDFLQKTGVIALDICYGGVGRPTYKYYCIDYNADIAKM